MSNVSKASVSIKKLAAISEAINAYSDSGAAKKDLLHSAGKSFLRVLAADLGLVKGEYEIRSNLGGIAVSGEVTLHGESIYVDLSESLMSRNDGVGVMYRSCSGRKDYSGHRNHFSSMKRLADDGYDDFVAECKRLIANATATA